MLGHEWIHSHFESLRKIADGPLSDDQQRFILDEIKQFFASVDCREWSMKFTGDVNEVFEFSLEHPAWNNRPIKISHVARLNRWRIDNRFISIGELSTDLGVPIAYLHGIRDMIQMVHVTFEGATHELNSAKHAIEELAAERDRLKDIEQSLTYRAVAQKAVRNARKSAGAKAKIQIAACRRDCWMTVRQCRQETKLALMNATGWPHDFPPVPGPMADALPERNSTLPSTPGIYFVWNAGVVVYVGQSVCLLKRARLGHSNIHRGDRLSWVEIDAASLYWAECFYIGLMRPCRNRWGQSDFIDVEPNKRKRRRKRISSRGN